jgi:hypothetical protein
MDERAEKAEFGRLVQQGVITYLSATPLAMRLRGWVDGAQPGDPVVEEILAIRAMEREVSGD